ncbi:MAG: hypothetical protein VXW70_00270 [Candidatus Thermoplasmatota archaeon]|nr:hypothetical protein [Candidatus Thermoplasmatota archaeon]MEC8249668.1 hypothetical protein [Candidatus Thermoplasmatota archaeon]MEC8258623.1 hypothetical protein [Candidatus Thermoplasmatota archaeon]MEC8312721.1 hypothetical protein [Candidatus Thermoplasmatota archaeon]
MEVNNKLGVGLMVSALLLVILGTVGFTIDDSVDSIPTPNVPNSVFFADEPMQSNPLALLVSANADITWDRNDVFLVIGDADKKSQCDGLTFIEMVNQNSEVCTSRDNEFAAIGDDNQSGLSWQAKSGEYYVGIGTFSEVVEDFELNVDYEIKMTLSPAGYFVMLLMFMSGFVLNKYK